MKAGSIVECINDKNFRNLYPVDLKPVNGRFYTIRGFDQTGNGVYLEEIISRTYVGHNIEAAWLKSRFLEVMPPINIDIESILSKEVIQ